MQRDWRIKKMKDNHDEFMELLNKLQAQFSVLTPKDEAIVIKGLKAITDKIAEIVQKMDYEGELD